MAKTIKSTTSHSIQNKIAFLCCCSLFLNSGVLSPLLQSLSDIMVMYDNLSAFILYVKKSLPSNLKHFCVSKIFPGGNL